MSQCGQVAVKADKDVMATSEPAILNSASVTSNVSVGAKRWKLWCTKRRSPSVKKADLAVSIASTRRFPVKAVAEAFGAARSNLVGQMSCTPKRCGPY